MTIPLQGSVVYGPVQSRRLGVSLGINLLPLDLKFCSSDCIYCQYGHTDFEKMKSARLPKADELLKEIEKDFAKHAAEGRTIDVITLSGNGEPTLHPEFPLIVRELKVLRDRYLSRVRISILSDSSQVHRKEVRQALMELDQRYMKLDVGTVEMFRQLNHPFTGVQWERMIEGLKQLPDTMLQSLFISAPVDSAAPKPVEEWVRTAARIRPKGIHIYTISRSAADPRVKAVLRERLEEIAGFVAEKTGVHAEVIGTGGAWLRGGCR